MKYFLIALLFIPSIVLCQTVIKKELDSLNTVEEAQLFIETHKSAKGKILTFNKEKHKTRLAEELFKVPKGGKKAIASGYKTTYYKVLEKSKIKHDRVHYILLDGTQLTSSEIENTRNDILEKHKLGYDFKTLATRYSMDINAKKGGDSGWFTKGMMPTLFENAVESHDLNDIFTVNIAQKNAYYVVLKSFKSKVIEEITVVKFSETTR